MIFYFSGTGNSFYLAKNIAEIQGEELVSIAKELEKNYSVFEYGLKENELLGFVFPVYAWGPPKIVLDFITKIKIKNKSYVFSLASCGGNEGATTDIVQKTLKREGLELDSAFTIIMPNNYMVGIDVDSEEVKIEKLKNSEQRLSEINNIIKNRKTGVFQTIPGKMPFLKSFIVNTLFNMFALNTKRFYTTYKCTGCKICEKTCPIHSITVKDVPIWSKPCTQCFACINHCPTNAIQYGKGTVNKGRYLHPILKENS